MTSLPENIYPQYRARTTKKGRFLIEDYSDCVVKDYNKFIVNLKSCDLKQSKINEDNLKKIIKIIEIQNTQIKLIKEVIGKDDILCPFFNKTCDTINTLLDDVKSKFNE